MFGPCTTALKNDINFVAQTFPPKPKFSVDQIPDLTGRVMIVTGATLSLYPSSALHTCRSPRRNPQEETPASDITQSKPYSSITLLSTSLLVAKPRLMRRSPC